jgi:transposase
MQGRKDYTEKLFTSFQLSSRVPKENLYRKLRETLDLSFLYNDTRELYGKTGNPSIDPVVFFKLLLTGYLENITSDRKLVEHCSMRMDVLYFLGFDIDEELPWHSTISRTSSFTQLRCSRLCLIKFLPYV